MKREPSRYVLKQTAVDRSVLAYDSYQEVGAVLWRDYHYRLRRILRLADTHPERLKNGFDIHQTRKKYDRYKDVAMILETALHYDLPLGQLARVYDQENRLNNPPLALVVPATMGMVRFVHAACESIGDPYGPSRSVLEHLPEELKKNLLDRLRDNDLHGQPVAVVRLEVTWPHKLHTPKELELYTHVAVNRVLRFMNAHRLPHTLELRGETVNYEYLQEEPVVEEQEGNRGEKEHVYILELTFNNPEYYQLTCGEIQYALHDWGGSFKITPENNKPKEGRLVQNDRDMMREQYRFVTEGGVPVCSTVKWDTTNVEICTEITKAAAQVCNKVDRDEGAELATKIKAKQLMRLMVLEWVENYDNGAEQAVEQQFTMDWQFKVAMRDTSDETRLLGKFFDLENWVGEMDEKYTLPLSFTKNKDKYTKLKKLLKKKELSKQKTNDGRKVVVSHLKQYYPSELQRYNDASDTKLIQYIRNEEKCLYNMFAVGDVSSNSMQNYFSQEQELEQKISLLNKQIIEAVTKKSDEKIEEKAKEERTEAGDAEAENGERTGAEVGREEGAETGRTEAETGRTVAETGRTEAETGRTVAETGRTEAEKKREGAETGRTEAEKKREGAETGRTEAEQKRTEAEQKRTEAEQKLKTEVDGLKSKCEECCKKLEGNEDLKTELTKISKQLELDNPAGIKKSLGDLETKISIDLSKSSKELKLISDFIQDAKTIFPFLTNITYKNTDSDNPNFNKIGLLNNKYDPIQIENKQLRENYNKTLLKKYGYDNIIAGPSLQKKMDELLTHGKDRNFRLDDNHRFSTQTGHYETRENEGGNWKSPVEYFKTDQKMYVQKRRNMLNIIMPNAKNIYKDEKLKTGEGVKLQTKTDINNYLLSDNDIKKLVNSNYSVTNKKKALDAIKDYKEKYLKVPRPYLCYQLENDLMRLVTVGLSAFNGLEWDDDIYNLYKLFQKNDLHTFFETLEVCFDKFKDRAQTIRRLWGFILNMEMEDEAEDTKVLTVILGLMEKHNQSLVEEYKKLTPENQNKKEEWVKLAKDMISSDPYIRITGKDNKKVNPEWFLRAIGEEINNPRSGDYNLHEDIWSTIKKDNLQRRLFRLLTTNDQLIALDKYQDMEIDVRIFDSEDLDYDVYVKIPVGKNDTQFRNKKLNFLKGVRVKYLHGEEIHDKDKFINTIKKDLENEKSVHIAIQAGYETYDQMRKITSKEKMMKDHFAKQVFPKDNVTFTKLKPALKTYLKGAKKYLEGKKFEIPSTESMNEEDLNSYSRYTRFNSYIKELENYEELFIKMIEEGDPEEYIAKISREEIDIPEIWKSDDDYHIGDKKLSEIASNTAKKDRLFYVLTKINIPGLLNDWKEQVKKELIKNISTATDIDKTNKILEGYPLIFTGTLAELENTNNIFQVFINDIEGFIDTKLNSKDLGKNITKDNQKSIYEKFIHSQGRLDTINDIYKKVCEKNIKWLFKFRYAKNNCPRCKSLSERLFEASPQGYYDYMDSFVLNFFSPC